MALKDPAARSAYQAAYRARPENRDKIRAKGQAWRDNNPEAARAQYRRSRQNAREREALAALEVAKASKPAIHLPALRLLERATKTAKQIVHAGYSGTLRPGGF